MFGFGKKKEYGIVAPHRKVSKKVTMTDYEKVLEEEKKMRAFMAEHKTCIGLAHPQFESKKPLRFFITHHEIVINPEVLRHSSYEASSVEGCMTYPGRPHTRRGRFHKMDVKYETFVNGEHETKERTVSGLESCIFQHEIDHLDGKYCYDGR